MSGNERTEGPDTTQRISDTEHETALHMFDRELHGAPSTIVRPDEHVPFTVYIFTPDAYARASAHDLDGAIRMARNMLRPLSSPVHPGRD